LAKLVTWPVIAPRSTYFKVTRPSEGKGDGAVAVASEDWDEDFT